jgi:tetratricopeptide (TPR) repeat protein
MTPKIAACAACLVLAACGQGVPGPREPGSPAAPKTPAEAPSASAARGPPTPTALRASPRGEIAALESLYAGVARDSPERPVLLRRLADEYVALETVAQRETGERAQAIVQVARRKAIAYYAQLAAEYAKWCAGACTDEVLFHLASEHEAAGETAEARRAYHEIIRSWPASRYLPNAYLSFAELFFEEAGRDPAKLAPAEKAYQEVLRFPPPDNKLAAYAHYKLAYVHFNRGDTTRALDEMTKAIEVSEAQQSPDLSELARNARRDLVPIYAAGGDPSRAYDFLSARSGDRPGDSERLHVMLDALAQSYLDNDKLDAAMDLHLDWLSRGAGPKTCAVVRQIDAVLARATTTPGQRARVKLTAAASAPLMKARVQCASAALGSL